MTLSPSSLAGRSSDERVGQLAEEFLERLSRGEKPTADEYAARHPDLAELIHQAFPALEIMGQAPALQPEGNLTHSSCVLGDYEILREVGRGGMGVVYEAQQISLERRVALKVLPFAAVLDERQIKRFRNEARAAAQLKHPNIVQVFGVGCERSVHFYAMEFVEGQSLAEVIADLRRLVGNDGSLLSSNSLANSISSAQSNTIVLQAQSDRTTASGKSTPLSPDPSTRTPEYFRGVARLVMQVAEGLDHAHQEGVIHRDIKPSNLMIDANGKPWITDFGLARIDTDAGMTMSGDMLGTLRCMSPEQTLASRVVVDHRTDIYSLGVTMYELLTLRPAFAQADKHELLRHIAFEDPPRPRKINRRIPAELETIVQATLQKRPDDRFYSTAQEMADDLRRYLGDEPIKVRPPGTVQSAFKWAKRRRKVLAVALGALLLAASTGVVAMGYSYSEVLKERDRAVRAETAARNAEREARDTLDQLQRVTEEVVDDLETYSKHGNIWPKRLYGARLLAVGQREKAEQMLSDYFHECLRYAGDPVVKEIGLLYRLMPDDPPQRSERTTCLGRRFTGADSFGVVPGLYFDGVPPWTIEVIFAREAMHTPDGVRGEDMNLVAWTQMGSASLCTTHGDKWALWLGGAAHADSSNRYRRAIALSPSPLNQQQHIAGVWDGDRASLYIDGKHQSTVVAPEQVVRRKLTANPMAIAADPNPGLGFAEFFVGTIATVRVTRGVVYTEEFDPPAILRETDDALALFDFRYDEGDYAFDRSGNGHHAILLNAEPVPLNEK